MESIQHCLSPSTQLPSLHRGNWTKYYFVLWISRKSTVWLQKTTPTTMTQSVLCWTQHFSWRGSLFSASVFAAKFITVCKMADQRSVEMFAVNFASRQFAYRRLAQGLIRSMFVSQASCTSTWTQLSQLTNVLNTWTELWLQPTMLMVSPGTFAQSSHAFAKQDWNWQLENAILESDSLKSLAEPFHQKVFHRKFGKFQIFFANSDYL